MGMGYIDVPLESQINEWLGVKDHIDALSEFMLACPTPMTIAVQGDWGTGKTSMMNMVQEKMRSQEIETIWFNTWQFSQFSLQDEVPIALLTEMLRSIGYGTPEVKKIALGLARRVAVLTAGVIAGADGSAAVRNATESDPVDAVCQIKQLKDRMANAIRNKLDQSGKDRIIIFIDDLDRMNPGKAVELLEVIKNFLDLRGCVFVLAVDYGVVSRGVKEKYGVDMDEMKGRSFFDKIIQLPFNLPVAQYNISNYLKNLLDVPDEERDFYIKLAANSVGTNPRTLKRMANILSLLELVAQKSDPAGCSQPEYRRLLFGVLCMQMAFEPVYAKVLGERMDSKFLEWKPEQIRARFSADLEKCPGRKEELENRLVNFLQALNESLPEREGDDDLFSSVLHMSGITASGSQAPQMVSEAQSFDPLLEKKLEAFAKELSGEHTDLWKILGDAPKKEENLDIPVSPASAIVFACKISEKQFCFFFYTKEPIKIKRAFYQLIKELDPEIESEMKYSGRKRCFLELSPGIKWKTSAKRKGEEASEKRFSQLHHEFSRRLDKLLPALTTWYQKKEPVLAMLQSLVSQIVENLHKIFPEEKGWRLEENDKYFYAEHIAEIRKNEWDENFAITIGSDAEGCRELFIGFSTRENEQFEKSNLGNAIYKCFRVEKNRDSDSVGRDESWAVWIYLPDGMKNWTDGSIFTDDFSFSLDAKQQKEVVQTIISYAKRFADMEEKLDALAKSGE